MRLILRIGVPHVNLGLETAYDAGDYCEGWKKKT